MRRMSYLITISKIGRKMTDTRLYLFYSLPNDARFGQLFPRKKCVNNDGIFFYMPSSLPTLVLAISILYIFYKIFNFIYFLFKTRSKKGNLIKSLLQKDEVGDNAVSSTSSKGACVFKYLS
jgi:hypothetical protein